MNTVISYYNSRISDTNSPAELVDRANLKRRKIIQPIDDLIEGLVIRILSKDSVKPPLGIRLWLKEIEGGRPQ